MKNIRPIWSLDSVRLGSIDRVLRIYQRYLINYLDSGGKINFTTDPTGVMQVINYGSYQNALPYSGRAIELGATNDVDIPIHHTLGSELVTNGTFDTDTNWTKGTGWTISAGVASSNGTQVADSLLTTSTIPTTVAGGTYLISFEVTAYTAGNVALQFDGIEIIPDKAAAGVYSAEAIASDTTGTVDIVADLNFVGSVDNVTVKQITNSNSYLTYYDFTDGLVTVDNSLNTPSTKYTLNTKTVNNIITHTTPWSVSDWAKINNNPNLIGKLARETTGATKTIPELDMVMDAGASPDSYYMCSENSGGILYNARPIYYSDFSSTIDGWVEPRNSSTLSVSNSILRTTADGINTYGMAKELTGLTIGRTYYILRDFRIGAATGMFERVASDVTLSNDQQPFAIADTDSLLLRSFTATHTTMYYGFLSSSDNTYFELASMHFSDDVVTIANYASTIRTNADFQQKGIQKTAFVTDGAGTPLSYTSNILNFDANSYIDTLWNPSIESKFWLEEVIDGVVYQHKYDGTNLTTYTDNVAGAPSAHSPENANYLLGKGVYPKVTADPYTAYVNKIFLVLNGSQYDSYNQPARYAVLAAL